MGWHWGILAASGAGAAGAYELIQSVVLSSNQASVTFSTIDSNYKHLQVRWVARSDRSGQPRSSLYARLNGTEGNTFHYIFGNGSSVTSAGASGVFMEITNDYPAATETANAFASGITDISDVQATNKNKTLRTLWGYHASNNRRIALTSNLWINTAAITSVTFYDGTGSNILAGSRFSLYGIKG